MADALNLFSSAILGAKIKNMLTDWQPRVEILPIIIDMTLHHGAAHHIETGILTPV